MTTHTLVLMLNLTTSLSSFADPTTVVVVVDPQAQSSGFYSGGMGNGNGYYWSDELSRVAMQELGVALSRRGFLVLLNAGEVEPTQEELRLENSEWGRFGRSRNDIGYFSGASESWYVSAYTVGGTDQEFQLALQNASPSARLSRLAVKVIVRRTNTKTREIPEILEGSASKTLIKDVNLQISSGNPWLRLASSFAEARLTSWSDAGRAATRVAIGVALRGVKAPQTLTPTSVPAGPTAPRFIYLALRGEVMIGDSFGIWRGNRQIAEVVVEQALDDGRARCRVATSEVSDLGRPGDTARPLTPTIPIE